MALNLNQKIYTFLKSHPNERFTARDIANWVFKNFPDECAEKQNRSKATIIPLNNDADLIQQLVKEIGAQRLRIENKYSQIKTTEERPRNYYYTEDSDEVEILKTEQNIIEKEKTTDQITTAEETYYPVLWSYLNSELNIYSKRIDEKHSSNKLGHNANKWLHPDLVGMEDLSREWDREIKDCVKEYSDKKAKLYSFEVKTKINRSNLREAFFQTVSNSSWANFGYLVVGEISSNNNILNELHMLCALHGIGIILLDKKNPAESQILIPAKERDSVDWDTANRLVKEKNIDFINYIKNIRKFYQTGEISTSDWPQPKPNKKNVK